MKNQNKTIYSRFVALKKCFIKKQIIPDKFARIIDAFFNGPHNSFIISKDLARDAIIKSKDVTRDSIIKSSAITKDAIIKSRDLARDSVIKSSAITKDAIIKSRDMARDSVIRSKDVARDSIERSKDLTENAIKNAGLIKIYAAFPFVFIKNLIFSISSEIRLRKFAVTEKTDQEAVLDLQKIIVNSENVKQRVKTFYGRDSIVVNPPVETCKMEYKNEKNYWLSVNRLTPEKRIEMQILAFKKMPGETLVVIGGYDDCHAEYAQKLKGMNQDNVFFTNFVDDKDLLVFYSECKGFIATSKDEDFGMNVVEAMASGKPVIAPNEGGYKETIINSKTGILIDDINEDKIIEAINIIGQNPKQYKNACIEQAKKFDTKIFIEKIRKAIL